MLALLSITLFVVSFFINNFYLQISPIIISSFYALILTPDTFFGGKELSREKIKSFVDIDWNRADEITNFIIKYWASFKHIHSAERRGGSASALSVLSFVISFYLYYKNFNQYIMLWSTLNAIMLFVIGNRSNKALYILKSTSHPQWNIVCISFIVLGDLLNSLEYKNLRLLMPDDKLNNAIYEFKKLN